MDEELTLDLLASVAEQHRTRLREHSAVMEETLKFIDELIVRIERLEAQVAVLQAERVIEQ